MSSTNQPATRQDVEEIVTKSINGAATSITTQILTAVGEQFDAVNDRIDEVEENLGERIDKLDRKFTGVTDQLADRVGAKLKS